jgi:hypothetical protein
MSLFATSIPVASAGPNLRPIILRVSVGRVKKGTEKQSCHPIKFPRSEQTAVDRIEIKVHGGSHHVHLYRPYNGEPVYPTYNCPFAVDFDHWQLVAATQTGALDWRLHPGVGIMFEARQPLMIQTHFVNTGFLDVKGRASAKMRLHPMAGTPTAYAGAFFGQDRTVLVPPGTGANATTLVNRCTITGEGPNARDMTIMAFTGHYHFRGTRFQVYKVHTDGSLDPTPVYDHTGYADPEFKEYPPEAPLVLKAGEGIEWWCTYDNDPVRWNNQTFKFGPNTEMNEHCNLFGFYYPTDTPQEAIDCIHKPEGMVRVVATD